MYLYINRCFVNVKVKQSLQKAPTLSLQISCTLRRKFFLTGVVTLIGSKTTNLNVSSFVLMTFWMFKPRYPVLFFPKSDISLH